MGFLDTIKDKWKIVCLVVYGFCAIMLFLPAISAMGAGMSAFQVLFEGSFFGIIYFIVPIVGIVLTLIMGDQKNYMIHIILCIAGIILLFVGKAVIVGVIAGEAGSYGGLVGSFISMGIGSILSLIVYLVGGVMSFLCMSQK